MGHTIIIFIDNYIENFDIYNKYPIAFVEKSLLIDCGAINSIYSGFSSDKNIFINNRLFAEWALNSIIKDIVEFYEDISSNISTTFDDCNNSKKNNRKLIDGIIKKASYYYASLESFESCEFQFNSIYGELFFKEIGHKNACILYFLCSVILIFFNDYNIDSKEIQKIIIEETFKDFSYIENIDNECKGSSNREILLRDSKLLGGIFSRVIERLHVTSKSIEEISSGGFKGLVNRMSNHSDTQALEQVKNYIMCVSFCIIMIFDQEELTNIHRDDFLEMLLIQAGSNPL